jgi:hypothetical protein
MTMEEGKSINHKILKYNHYLEDSAWHFDVDDYDCDVCLGWDKLDYCCSSGYQHLELK